MWWMSPVDFVEVHIGNCFMVKNCYMVDERCPFGGLQGSATRIWGSATATAHRAACLRHSDLRQVTGSATSHDSVT